MVPYSLVRDPTVLQVVLAISLALIMSQPAPGTGLADAPQPGEPGGGGLPTSPSLTLLASLALVPAGLIAVSVFPPWTFPRTVPAVGVIFEEGMYIQCTLDLVTHLVCQKTVTKSSGVTK